MHVLFPEEIFEREREREREGERRRIKVYRGTIRLIVYTVIRIENVEK